MSEKMITIHGHTIKGAIEMPLAELKRLIAEAEATPADGIYRFASQTDECPFKSGCYLAKYESGQWFYQNAAGGEWHNSPNPSGYTEAFRSGTFVPYTPPSPTFQVGQWVVPYGESDLPAVQITGIGNGVVAHYYRHNGATHHSAHVTELRLATPEEIAAATRIVPKVGMLLKRHGDGRVFLITELMNNASLINNFDLEKYQPALTLTKPALNTENFTILDSYTVQGVR